MRRPSGLVFRTAFTVLSATFLVGLLTHQVAERITRKHSEAVQRESLEGLLDVMTPSAAAACFARDQILAQQVVKGLAATPSVRAARLKDDQGVLAETHSEDGGATATLSRPIRNPFDTAVILGTLEIQPDPVETERLVANNQALVRGVVGILALTLGTVLALLIHRSVTHPIRVLSRRLHALEATEGARLRLPTGHEHNEIGQLVRDVNALVGRLVSALQKERELSEQLELDHRKVQAILENSRSGIFVVGADGALQECTPAFLKLLHLPKRTALGVRASVLFGLAAGEVESLLARCLESHTRQRTTLRLQNLEGELQRVLKLTMDPIGPDWIQGLLEDVTTHVKAAEAAEELAQRDPLTGALNRLGGAKLFESIPASHGSAVLLVDLDRFKPLNDTHGHGAGDAMLQAVCSRMEKILRRTDAVVRIGGDEFVVVVPQLQDPDAALRLGEKLIAALSQPLQLTPDLAVEIGASIGVAMIQPGSGTAWEDALQVADQAMYAAKAAGKGRACLSP